MRYTGDAARIGRAARTEKGHEMVTETQLKQAAAEAARGSPSIGEYDGYVYEQPGGTWQAEAAGLIVGSGLSYETALTLVGEHGAGRPVWKVTHGGGEAELLKAAA
jgi:hypothetical protein